MEDALSVLGDGARCRVPVTGAVSSTISHLMHNSGRVVLTKILGKIISTEYKGSIGEFS